MIDFSIFTQVNALLGEMSAVGGQVVWANDVTVAYAAQKAWLLNNTVKNNILFGQPYIKERYEAILQACALKSDLEILPAGIVKIAKCTCSSSDLIYKQEMAIFGTVDVQT